MKSNQAKIDTVICRNTFFFNNLAFEQKYESHINAITNILKNLRCKIQNGQPDKELIFDIIRNQDKGLAAILALTGLSNEMFKRLITAISVIDDVNLSKLVNKNDWIDKINHKEGFKEVSDAQIRTLIQDNDGFLNGLVNLFFEGASNSYLIEKLPLFDLKKLSISKMGFEINELLDTIVRYKEKGSYSGQSENNA